MKDYKRRSRSIAATQASDRELTARVSSGHRSISNASFDSEGIGIAWVIILSSVATAVIVVAVMLSFQYGWNSKERTAERDAALEALGALKGVQAVTRAGLTIGDYAPRVLDANIQVDKFLRGEGDPALKEQIRDAMALYTLAASAWRAKISLANLTSTNPLQDVAQDPALNLCSEVRASPWPPGFVESAFTPTEQLGVRVAWSVPLLWSCASTRIAQAEQILVKGRSRR